MDAVAFIVGRGNRGYRVGREGHSNTTRGNWEAKEHPLVWDMTSLMTFATIFLEDCGGGGTPGQRDGMAVGVRTQIHVDDTPACTGVPADDRGLVV